MQSVHFSVVQGVLHPEPVL